VIGSRTRELHQAITVRRDVLADALEIIDDATRDLRDVLAGRECDLELVDRGDLDLRDVSQLVADTTGERAERRATLREQQLRARGLELLFDRCVDRAELVLGLLTSNDLFLFFGQKTP
jgi:hypothetical protein